MNENNIVGEVEETSNITMSMISITNLIYIIRGKQVMLDSDLAILYQVETKALNRSVKRNSKRFPDDFCFQLTLEEYETLRCQIDTSKSPISMETDKRGGRRYLPYVFTEQGISMLASVLRSEIAIKVSIGIMRAFVEMRRFISNNELLFERISDVELKQLEYQKTTDEKLEQVFAYISAHQESSQKIFFEGQIFDAFSLLTELVGHAKGEIILIDGYVDVVTLNILAKKNLGVSVIIYTLPSARLTTQDVANFNTQYPLLEVKRTTAFHDRFLIIDNKEGYHIGASIKDAGKKCFGINKIEDLDVIRSLIMKAQKTGKTK